jgi:hypothetical protein
MDVLATGGGLVRGPGLNDLTALLPITSGDEAVESRHS